MGLLIVAERQLVQARALRPLLDQPQTRVDHLARAHHVPQVRSTERDIAHHRVLELREVWEGRPDDETSQGVPDEGEPQRMRLLGCPVLDPPQHLLRYSLPHVKDVVGCVLLVAQS